MTEHERLTIAQPHGRRYQYGMPQTGPWYNPREREWAMYVDGFLLRDHLGRVRYFLTAEQARGAVGST
jgi:hypothetical protein